MFHASLLSFLIYWKRKKWVGSHASNGGYEEEKANLSGRRSVPVCKEENGGGNLNQPMKHWGKDGA